jgi:hypothetical protein
VLLQLVELITPRLLQEAGPGGRPLVDYVCDVYSNLMNIGKGINRQADNCSDISSNDYSDDKEEKDGNGIAHHWRAISFSLHKLGSRKCANGMSSCRLLQV